MKEVVKQFLNRCGIKIENNDQLDGLMIPRDILLSTEKYTKIRPDIIEMRGIFSSSAMTSLHRKAGEQQKWPLLNLVRQILRAHHYDMIPLRKSNGYTKDGKKKYKRFFSIRKNKQHRLKD